MKTVHQIAETLGISDQRLTYWLAKPDAPIPEYRLVKKRMIRFYDENEIEQMWNER